MQQACNTGSRDPGRFGGVVTESTPGGPASARSSGRGQAVEVGLHRARERTQEHDAVVVAVDDLGHGEGRVAAGSRGRRGRASGPVREGPGEPRVVLGELEDVKDLDRWPSLTCHLGDYGPVASRVLALDTQENHALASRAFDDAVERLRRSVVEDLAHAFAADSCVTRLERTLDFRLGYPGPSRGRTRCRPRRALLRGGAARTPACG